MQARAFFSSVSLKWQAIDVGPNLRIEVEFIPTGEEMDSKLPVDASR